MSKRLQVLLDEEDFAEVQRAARERRVSVADWVRDAIRLAKREQPSSSPERKIAAIRAAAQHQGPTADIDVMLEEIERGYVSDPSL
ncbi:MAG TPA: CopG family transcriptional regulator [Thermoanaerobaculia bacterium]|jgi:hypothetical protein|nr:CopG family transcriptional regulator [Thermoanaerobaculia bacterium]